MHARIQCRVKRLARRGNQIDHNTVKNNVAQRRRPYFDKRIFNFTDKESRIPEDATLFAMMDSKRSQWTFNMEYAKIFL